MNTRTVSYAVFLTYAICSIPASTDLGKVPIKLDNVVVHKLADDASSVQFDLDVVWDGECDIQMRSDYGLQFGVKSVKLSGRMSFLLCPLTEVLPVVSAIQYSFINVPDLELNFTGLAQLADFTIIDKTIRAMILDVLSGMMVLPNRMLYKMDYSNDYLKTYQPPLGIVHVTAVRGRGFVVEEGILANDVPDVYLLTQFGSSPTPWRTKTVWNDLNPVWDESAHFVLSDYDQVIRVHAWDEDRSPLDPDDDLGEAEMTVGDLLVAGGAAEMELLIDGEMSGAQVTLACEVLPLTTTDIFSFDDPLCSGPHKLCGCLIILVTKAFDIPLKVEKASTFVKVSFAKHEFFTSVVTNYPGVDALNPVYDASFMVPLTTDIVRSSHNVAGVVEISLIDNATVLGTTTIELSDLAEFPGNKIQQKRKIGRGGASIEFQIIMYGVDMSKASQFISDIVAADHETLITPMKQITPVKQITLPSPILNDSITPRPGDMGKVKITAVRGRGFKIQKKAFQKNDVPDMYLKMSFGSGKNQQKWQTGTIKDSKMPEWNESTQFAVNDQEETLRIEAFDEDKGVGDGNDFLGYAEVTVTELLLAAKEVELPLTVTTLGKSQSTGTFITIDCEMVGVDMDGSWSAASSLGMSTNTSFGSISSHGSMSFGTSDWKEKTRAQVKLEFERMKN